MKKLFIILVILFGSVVVLAEKVADLTELEKPHAIECDGENFYIMDEATVHVYSMKDYKHVRRFGSRGDGPYQLVPGSEVPIQLSLLSNNIQLCSMYKMVTYSKIGKPIDEKVFHRRFLELTPIKKNFAAVELDVDPADRRVHIYSVQFIQSGFEDRKKLIQFDIPPIGVKGRNGFGIPVFTHINVANDNLYVFSQQHDNEIFVYNADGKEIKRIKVNLPRLKVTDSVKKGIFDYLIKSKLFKIYGLEERSLDKTVFFYEYLPSFRMFKMKGGIIYLQTYEQKGDNFRFVLMDLNGKILKTLYLPVEVYDLLQMGTHTTYCFDKNTYYYLVDNDEAETWELHKVKF